VDADDELVPSDSEANAYFGVSVSLNDAGNVALVGAYYDDADSLTDSGAAYVFTYSSGSWTETKLVPSDSEANANFGWSVSLNAAGNVALVGAPYDDANSLTNSGAAYVFTYSVVDVSWTQTTKLVPSDSEAEAYFGYSVSLNAAGDVALVGAHYDDANSLT
jgi:subtilisin family serine protease